MIEKRAGRSEKEKGTCATPTTAKRHQNGAKQSSRAEEALENCLDDSDKTVSVTGGEIEIDSRSLIICLASPVHNVISLIKDAISTTHSHTHIVIY